MHTLLATTLTLLLTASTSVNPLQKRNIGGIRLCDQPNWAGNCWYGVVPLNDCIALNSLYVYLQSLYRHLVPVSRDLLTYWLTTPKQQRQSPLLPARRWDRVFFDAVSSGFPPLHLPTF
jgi:hypothetical protein